MARKKFRWTPENLAEYTRLNTEGWSDTEIATKFDCDRHVLHRKRVRLDLPCQATGKAGVVASARYRRKVAENTKKQLKKKGMKSLAEERVAAFRRFAANNGWPEDLAPRAVQILHTLANKGARTQRQLCEDIGMEWHGSRRSLKSNSPSGSYLGDLQNRGLVVRLHRGRGVGNGKGKGESLYMLTALAVGIIMENIDGEK